MPMLPSTADNSQLCASCPANETSQQAQQRVDQAQSVVNNAQSNANQASQALTSANKQNNKLVKH